MLIVELIVGFSLKLLLITLELTIWRVARGEWQVDTFKNFCIYKGREPSGALLRT